MEKLKDVTDTHKLLASGYLATSSYLAQYRKWFENKLYLKASFKADLFTAGKMTTNHFHNKSVLNRPLS